MLNQGIRADESLLLSAEAFALADTVEARSALYQTLSTRLGLVAVLRPVASSLGQTGDPRGAATLDHGLAMTSDHEGGFHMWDVSAHRDLGSIDLDQGVRDVAIASTDELTYGVVTEDGTLSVLTGQGRGTGWDAAHDVGYGLTAFTPDGTKVAAATLEGDVDVFSTDDGRRMGSWYLPARSTDSSPLSLSSTDSGMLALTLDDATVYAIDPDALRAHTSDREPAGVRSHLIGGGQPRPHLVGADRGWHAEDAVHRDGG